MNRSILKLLASAAALGMLVAAPAVADGHGDGDHDPKQAKSKTQTEEQVCSDGDLVVSFLGDQTLWPPNHKYSPLTVEAVNDGLTDITLTTNITHDEYLADFVPTNDSPEEEQRDNEEVGAGNTVNDASPFIVMDTEASPNTNTHEVRAERSGRGDGRTYTIDVMADDGDNNCSGSVEISVPHDMGNGAENKRDHTEG